MRAESVPMQPPKSSTTHIVRFACCATETSRVRTCAEEKGACPGLMSAVIVPFVRTVVVSLSSTPVAETLVCTFTVSGELF